MKRMRATLPKQTPVDQMRAKAIGRLRSARRIKAASTVFFNNVKKERLSRQIFRSRESACADFFD